MPSDDVARSEAQRVQTMRTAIIAGAIGSVAGAIVVMATVATVLPVINSSPAETEIATAPKPAPPVVAAPPPAPEKPSPSFNRLAESPVGKEGCEDQTWPNIESRCLTRVDNAPRETTGDPVAKPPVAAVAPAELQPGSPALPNPSSLFEARSLAATPPPAVPQPQASAPQPPPQQPAPQAVPVNVNGQPHLVPQEVTRPGKPPKAAATKRKTAERPRAPKNTRPVDDDDDDRTPTVTIYRDHGTTRQVIEEVIERPTVRYRSSAFGSIFRDDD